MEPMSWLPQIFNDVIEVNAEYVGGRYPVKLLLLRSTDVKVEIPESAHGRVPFSLRDGKYILFNPANAYVDPEPQRCQPLMGLKPPSWQ